MISTEQQPCPVCGLTESQPVHQTIYPEYDYPGTFTLRRCSGCRLLFNSPRLDDAALAALYGRNYYFFLRGDSSELNRMVSQYQRTVRLIEDDVTSKRSVDIGCGRGYFPALLARLGWMASGIELSTEAAHEARTRFGLDVFAGTVEQFIGARRGETFPVVTAVDVIEHVPAPDAFVAAAASLVEPGGRLIIDTPNAGARNITLKGVSWKGFNPFHIYLFTIDNLTRLCSRHGLAVETSFSYGNHSTPLSTRDRIVRALKFVGLMKPAAAVYYGLRKLGVTKSDPGPQLAAAAARIENEPAYPRTPDSRAPLSAAAAGDNIIVIARKT